MKLRTIDKYVLWAMGISMLIKARYSRDIFSIILSGFYMGLIYGLIAYGIFGRKKKQLIKEAHRNLIQKISRRGEKLVKQNIHEEKILVKLQGSFGEALIITDKRFYVLKWGFMAGNFLGGRCLDFGYSNVVGLEIKKGWVTGTFEVLTPASQNAQKSYWGTGSNSAITSDNVVTFFAERFNLFQEAVKIGRELIHNPYFKNSQNSQVESNYSELEKLAELKEKGIITQEEFEVKKKKILGL